MPSLFINPMHYSATFLQALGAAISAWSYCETSLDEYLRIFHRDPRVKALQRKIPNGFSNRTKLFRDAASLVFDTELGLANHIHAMLDHASILSEQRNILAHGQWLPGMEEHPKILFRRKAQVFFYTVPLSSLIEFELDACSLFARLGETLTWSISMPRSAPWMTSHERLALQAFYASNPEPPPIAPPQRPRHLSFRA